MIIAAQEQQHLCRDLEDRGGLTKNDRERETTSVSDGTKERGLLCCLSSVSQPSISDFKRFNHRQDFEDIFQFEEEVLSPRKFNDGATGQHVRPYH